MDKKRIDALITVANQNIGPLVDSRNWKINSTYDGKTSAFGVSMAIMGLKPTLAMYYKHIKKSAVQPRNILTVIANMLNDTDSNYPIDKFDDAGTFVNYVISNDRTREELSDIHKKVIECAIALKMVIRTYPQKTDTNEQ